MRKIKSKKDEDLLPEYDFASMSGGVKKKYVKKDISTRVLAVSGLVKTSKKEKDLLFEAMKKKYLS